MNKLARGLATAAVASALIIAPAAANAATYVPNVAAPTGSTSVVAGSTFTVTFPAGSFAPVTPVFFQLSGDSAASASLAATITKPSDAVGGLSVDVTLHDGAVGDYTLVGSHDGVSVSHAFSVAAADSAAALPDTGADNSAAAFWFAGGLLALGATTVVTLNVVRRNRAQA